MKYVYLLYYKLPYVYFRNLLKMYYILWAQVPFKMFKYIRATCVVLRLGLNHNYTSDCYGNYYIETKKVILQFMNH